MADVLNIAHRGASGRFPENTLSAFRAAIAAGADMCELDVHLTRDGVAVVIHDETVNRTTDGSGNVSQLTLAEIKELDAGLRFDSRFAGEAVPTLEEAISAMRHRCALNIELKGAGVEGAVCRIIEGLPGIDAILSSFDWNSLLNVKRIDARVPIGLLAEEDTSRLLDAAVEFRARAIHPRADLADSELCERAHELGLKVHVWTVDSPASMRNLARIGVDGIMTNYPDRLREVLAGN